MSILFVNGSPNKGGNTAALVKALMKDKAYETLNLTDYKIYAYGQQFPDDQFEEVIAAIKMADTIVLGSPLYWHSLCGALRNMLDRSYGFLQEGELAGKDCYFLFQGASPTGEQLAAGEYTVKRYASLYGMQYRGMATSKKEASALANG